MRQKILLIEDNDQNRYLATFLLEKHGYEVLPAVDGPTVSSWPPGSGLI